MTRSLHAVAKGLVRDETADLGRDDDLVLAGLDPLGREKLLRALRDGLDLCRKPVEDFRSHAAGYALIAVFDPSVLCHERHDDALGIDIALAHVAIGRQEQLAHMCRLGAQTAVDGVLARRDAARRHFGELLDQRGEIRLLRQQAGLHLLAQGAGLVGQGGRFINGARRLREQRELFAEDTPRLGGGNLGVIGIKAVEGILAVQPAAADADDAAALGHHRGMVDGLGALGDRRGEADGVRGQDADIIKVLPEQRHQLFQSRRDRVKIRGKGYFHF